ncbi:hypothetical protein [Streptomyces sp. NPDC007856]|uniref:hypothetical protein n=1 Tax=Streptomyces sp. NPDC007856 TaxID=3364781 RepID=UPI0036B033CF
MNAPLPERTRPGWPVQQAEGERNLGRHLFAAPADQRQAIIDELTVQRGGIPPTPAEIDLRQTVGEQLGRLPGVTVTVDDAAGPGHRTAAAMFINSVGDLGYPGRVMVVASDTVRDQLADVMPDHIKQNIDWQPPTAHTDTRTLGSREDAPTRLDGDSLLPIGASDRTASNRPGWEELHNAGAILSALAALPPAHDGGLLLGQDVLQRLAGMLSQDELNSILTTTTASSARQTANHRLDPSSQTGNRPGARAATTGTDPHTPDAAPDTPAPAAPGGASDTRSRTAPPGGKDGLSQEHRFPQETPAYPVWVHQTGGQREAGEESTAVEHPRQAETERPFGMEVEADGADSATDRPDTADHVFTSLQARSQGNPDHPQGGPVSVAARSHDQLVADIDAFVAVKLVENGTGPHPDEPAAVGTDLLTRLGLTPDQAADLALCVTLLNGVRQTLHPAGLNHTRALDDTHIGRRDPRATLAHDTAWTPVTHLTDVSDALEPGETALVIGYRATGPGHAIAIHQTTNGPRLIDPQAPPAQRVTTNLSDWNAVRTHAIVLTAQGHPKPDALHHPTTTSTAHALTDPPTDHRVGAPSLLKGLLGKKQPVIRDWTGLLAGQKMDFSHIYAPSGAEPAFFQKAPWKGPVMVVRAAQRGDAVRLDGHQVSYEEFADLLAGDAELAKGMRIVLWADLGGKPDLPRAVAVRTGHEVWSYTGTLIARRESDSAGAVAHLAPDVRPGRPVGRWMLSRPDGPGPLSLEHVGQVTYSRASGETATVRDSRLVTHTIVDLDGNSVGRAAHADTEWADKWAGDARVWAASREAQSAYLPSITKFSHVALTKENATVMQGPEVEVPWVHKRVKYFFESHGIPGHTLLPVTADGKAPAEQGRFSGRELGRMLRRRPSLNALPADAPIVMNVCHSAAVAQAVADATGRTVYAPTTATAMGSNPNTGEITRFKLVNGPNGEPGQWLVFHPSTTTQVWKVDTGDSTRTGLEQALRDRLRDIVDATGPGALATNPASVWRTFSRDPFALSTHRALTTHDALGSAPHSQGPDHLRRTFTRQALSAGLSVRTLNALYADTATRDAAAATHSDDAGPAWAPDGGRPPLLRSGSPSRRRSAVSRTPWGESNRRRRRPP